MSDPASQLRSAVRRSRVLTTEINDLLDARGASRVLPAPPPATVRPRPRRRVLVIPGTPWVPAYRISKGRWAWFCRFCVQLHEADECGPQDAPCTATWSPYERVVLVAKSWPDAVSLSDVPTLPAPPRLPSSLLEGELRHAYLVDTALRRAARLDQLTVLPADLAEAMKAPSASGAGR